MEKVVAMPGAGSCLLCGDGDDPTVEHIIPQTLWHRFGIDPDREDLAVFRTTLCGRHNEATSVLHERTDMMELIDSGEPVSRRTLQQLSDWAMWVTLLLGLARGSGVLDPEVSRDLLLRRFDHGDGSGVRGMRVYAARVSEYADTLGSEIVPYLVALHGDTSVLLDERGQPIGFTFSEGPINASESIGLGRVALLVLGRTYTSGPGHNDKVDQVVTRVGLERIHPLPTLVPLLTPRPVGMKGVSRLFTVLPFGADLSLTPAAIKSMWPLAADDSQDGNLLGEPLDSGDI